MEILRCRTDTATGFHQIKRDLANLCSDAMYLETDAIPHFYKAKFGIPLAYPRHKFLSVAGLIAAVQDSSDIYRDLFVVKQHPTRRGTHTSTFLSLAQNCVEAESRKLAYRAAVLTAQSHITLRELFLSWIERLMPAGAWATENTVLSLFRRDFGVRFEAEQFGVSSLESLIEILQDKVMARGGSRIIVDADADSLIVKFGTAPSAYYRRDSHALASPPFSIDCDYIIDPPELDQSDVAQYLTYKTLSSSNQDLVLNRILRIFENNLLVRNRAEDILALLPGSSRLLSSLFTSHAKLMAWVGSFEGSVFTKCSFRNSSDTWLRSAISIPNHPLVESPSTYRLRSFRPLIQDKALYTLTRRVLSLLPPNDAVAMGTLQDMFQEIYKTPLDDPDGLCNSAYLESLLSTCLQVSHPSVNGIKMTVLKFPSLAEPSNEADTPVVEGFGQHDRQVLPPKSHQEDRLNQYEEEKRRRRAEARVRKPKIKNSHNTKKGDVYFMNRKTKQVEIRAKYKDEDGNLNKTLLPKKKRNARRDGFPGSYESTDQAPTQVIGRTRHVQSPSYDSTDDTKRASDHCETSRSSHRSRRRSTSTSSSDTPEREARRHHNPGSRREPELDPLPADKTARGTHRKRAPTRSPSPGTSDSKTGPRSQKRHRRVPSSSSVDSSSSASSFFNEIDWRPAAAPEPSHKPRSSVSSGEGGQGDARSRDDHSHASSSDHVRAKARARVSPSDSVKTIVDDQSSASSTDPVKSEARVLVSTSDSFIIKANARDVLSRTPSKDLIKADTRAREVHSSAPSSGHSAELQLAESAWAARAAAWQASRASTTSHASATEVRDRESSRGVSQHPAASGSVSEQSTSNGTGSLQSAPETSAHPNAAGLHSSRFSSSSFHLVSDSRPQTVSSPSPPSSGAASSRSSTPAGGGPLPNPADVLTPEFMQRALPHIPDTAAGMPLSTVLILLHGFLGIPAPPPGQEDRNWLLVVAFIRAAGKRVHLQTPRPGQPFGTACLRRPMASGNPAASPAQLEPATGQPAGVGPDLERQSASPVRRDLDSSVPAVAAPSPRPPPPVKSPPPATSPALAVKTTRPSLATEAARTSTASNAPAQVHPASGSSPPAPSKTLAATPQPVPGLTPPTVASSAPMEGSPRTAQVGALGSPAPLKASSVGTSPAETPPVTPRAALARLNESSPDAPPGTRRAFTSGGFLSRGSAFRPPLRPLSLGDDDSASSDTPPPAPISTLKSSKLKASSKIESFIAAMRH